MLATSFDQILDLLRSRLMTFARIATLVWAQIKSGLELVGCGLAIFVFLVLKEISFATALGVTVGAVCVIVLWGMLSSHLEMSKPCAHGTRGAKFKSNICSACTRERELVVQAEEAARRVQMEIDHAAREVKARERAIELEAKAQRIATISGLRDMDPFEFQRFIWAVYKQLGYSVEASPPGRDGGQDGILERDGVRVALQCKRYQGDVGEPVIRDLYGTMLHHKCQRALLITTGRVTDPARQFARNKPIDMLDGTELLLLLADRQIDLREVAGLLVHRGVPRRLDRGFARCKRCGQAMRLRRGKHGRFLGCTGYPKCTFTRPA